MGEFKKFYKKYRNDIDTPFEGLKYIENSNHEYTQLCISFISDKRRFLTILKDNLENMIKYCAEICKEKPNYSIVDKFYGK
jgi:hypothetical protein